MHLHAALERGDNAAKELCREQPGMKTRRLNPAVHVNPKGDFWYEDGPPSPRPSPRGEGETISAS